MRFRSLLGHVFGFLLLLVSNSLAAPVNATSQLTPTLGTEVAYLDRIRDDSSESGAVTVISPGFNYLLDSPGADISVTYELDSVNYSDLDRSNEVKPNLNLDAVLIHKLELWQTQILGGIEQSNVDIDGLLSFSDEIFNSESQELRTLAVDTTWTDKLGSEIQYKANLGVNTADLEDTEPTQGANTEIAINNYLTGDVITWGGILNSEISESDSDDSQISGLFLNFNYRLNFRWQIFTDLTSIETDEEQLDQNSGLVGLSWKPKPNTIIRFGAGKLDHNDTYSLNAQVTQQKLQLYASYTEGITTARTDTLSRSNQDLTQPDQTFSGTTAFQSISIEPIVQQSANAGFKLEGSRSIFGVNLFDYERDPVVTDEIEKGYGLEMTFSRRLPKLASVGLDIRGQRSKLDQTSDLTEMNAYYERALTADLEMNVYLNLSKQTSTLATNEYEQARVGLSVFAMF